jgi:hypothetical protein
MNKSSINEINWKNIFMSFSIAVVFVMQQWHAMKLEDLKTQVVPRKEIEQQTTKFMHRDTILSAINRLNDRMDILEGKQDDSK